MIIAALRVFDRRSPSTTHSYEDRDELVLQTERCSTFITSHTSKDASRGTSLTTCVRLSVLSAMRVYGRLGKKFFLLSPGLSLRGFRSTEMELEDCRQPHAPLCGPAYTPCKSRKTRLLRSSEGAQGCMRVQRPGSNCSTELLFDGFAAGLCPAIMVAKNPNSNLAAVQMDAPTTIAFPLNDLRLVGPVLQLR